MTTTTAPVSRSLLRPVLRVDAVVSGVNGVAYLIAAGPLAELLGLPAEWLLGVGAFLAVFAGAVWTVGSRPPGAAVRAVVTANVLWVIGSVAVVLAGLGSPTTVGSVWLLLQAAVVAAFAAAQGAGLRRS